MNMLHEKRLTLLTLLLLLLLAALPAGAQTQSGVLTGTVTQGGVGLPGVRVTVSSPALQGTRTTDTDVNGSYIFPALPPGEYTAKFELEGLQTVSRRTSVTLSGNARADADMALTAVSESLTVTATAPSVIETSSIETNIQASTVENLPTLRTLLGTISLSPNTNTNGPGGATTISGAPSYDSTFYVNGTPINEVLRGQPLALFIEDAIQETTVLSGAISAEYGRFTGGVVNAISKSGGNQFSGSFRDTLTNPSWAEPSKLEEDLLDKTSNQYEATLGGRIVTDRLWFFTAGRYLTNNAQGFFEESTNSYNTTTDQRRFEGKLTGQITPKHSIVGSLLKLTAQIQDRCLAAACWDEASLSQDESQPQDLYSANYNGVFTNSLLMEAFGSYSSLTFDGSGGTTGTMFTATPNYDATTGNVSGASQFCGACGEEVRSSETYGIKPHYFLSTQSMGTHNIVGGLEHYSTNRDGDNHQSGSDFVIYNFTGPVRAENGAVLDTISPGAAFILWWPVLESSKGNDLATNSAFVNDKWDLNTKMSLNLGVRYDKNDGKDSAGKKVADDSKFSPRLGFTYDAFGNGRLRFNASYSQYVSQIQGGNIADASSPAGSPSILYWLYAGPAVTAPHDEFVNKVMTWFNSTGGINNRKFFGTPGGFLIGGGTNGIGTQIENSLKSPAVDEIAVGVSTQIGSKGYLRFDYQDREWNDFYENVLNQETGTIFDPLIGGEIDRGVLTNSNDFERKYKAFIAQGSYRFTPRFSIAGNYTLSELKGNSTGETTNAGPVGNVGSNFYPEFAGYEQRNPVGYLPQDQRHKLRAWATFDLPTFLGNFNISVLERYDSALSYSAIGTIDPIAGGAPSPSYYLGGTAYSSGGVNYYFGDRGAFRLDDISATDLGLNYQLGLGAANLFAQADIINVFNEQAQINARTTVNTAYNSGNFRVFNPYTDTPVECPQGNTGAQCKAMGANFQKASSFGTATNPTDYQQARTYRVSLGVRF